MKWKLVESSAISAIAYDRKTRVLQIRFQHGGYYTYQGIGYHRYSKLLRAESIGKYFNEAIKPRKAA